MPSNSLSLSELPIQGWFIPRVTPYGGAPEHIKKQWVDVPLPFRQLLPEGPEAHLGSDVMGIRSSLTVYEDGITIAGLDAVKSLQLFDRQEAADWWSTNYVQPQLSLSGVCNLVFGKNEGDILPSDLASMLLPGIETFDSIDI